MSARRRFSPNVARELGHYVYLYVDPISSDIFYVGKGQGNRAFSRLARSDDAALVRRLEEIRRAGEEPRIELLVHGIEDAETAYRVEAAAIDLLGKGVLTNQVRGWRSGTYGRMTLRQVEALYSADEAEIDDPVLLIRINRLFRYGMSDVELYDATRGIWRVGARRNQIEYALAVFEGIVQEVYVVEQWLPAGSTFSTRGELTDPDRWEFVGRIADEPKRSEYRYKSVRHLWDQGARNPIRYLNVPSG